MTVKITAAVCLCILATPALSAFAESECLGERDGPHCNDGNLWNGYWWEKRYWVDKLPSLETWFTPAPILSRGDVVFYAPGVMEGTARHRGLDLEGYVDGISLMSPADIGLPVWLKRPGHDWEGPFLVVDCAARQDIYPGIKFMGKVAELGNETAKRWGMVDGNKVHMWKWEDVFVSKISPEHVEGLIPVDYPSWWLENFQPFYIADPRVPIYEAPSTWMIDRDERRWVTFLPPTFDDLLQEMSLYMTPFGIH
jgi:hypothetical protein